jgi:putative spermidine/putrescine transport system substrate-binding protein
MKKIPVYGVLLGLVMILSACAAGGEPERLEAADLLQMEWSEIVALAEGKQVNIFMWGGDEGINRYMDEMVAPRLKQEYNITLKRTPMDTGDIIQKLLAEKRANVSVGNIDIIWINGDNFRNAKRNELLYGAFLDKLPHFQRFIDADDSHVHYDQGTPIEGMEAPWGSAQYVFFYNQAHIAEPPASFADILEWAEKNPGKFTYPHPKDFTGNGFLAHLLYESIGDPQLLLEREFDDAFVNEQARGMWEYLNKIKPYLWRTGDTYPESLEQLDQLYSQGEVWITMGFNEGRAESLVQRGVFPDSTASFVLETGSIGSVHYLSMPFNSPQPAAALVAINYMLSPEAQMAKLRPEMWGEGMVLDPGRLSMEDQQTLQSINRGSTVLSTEVLSRALLPELDAAYKDWLRETWLREVVQNR